MEWKKYYSLFRIRMLYGLQYRAAALAGIATQFAWGGLRILAFQAFYRADPSAFPMGLEALSSYIWLQQALLALLNSWFFDGELLEMITSGNVSYELCRPVNLYDSWLAKTMSIRVSRVLLRCLPILLFAAFLPKPYGLSAPASVSLGLLAALSTILGFLVLVTFSMLIYIAAFYTTSSAGVRIIAVNIVEFFSGSLLPLSFFPDWMQGFLRIQPFASIEDTPFMIYGGSFSQREALLSLLLQLLWAAVFWTAGRLWMKAALRRTVVHGG